MRNWTLIGTAALLAVTITACKSEEAPPEAETAAPAEPEAQDITTEAGFKALHPQKPDEPWPEMAGEAVQLGPVPAYLSLPEDARAPLPAVIVVHDRWGLDEHVKLWTDRLAAAGYAALAVDLYGGKTTRDGNEANALINTINTDEAREIFGRAVTMLEEDERVMAPAVGMLGWGSGGRWAMRGGMMLGDEIDAVVDYYGLPLTPPDEVRNMKMPVLGLFAKKDISTPPPAVDALDKWLTEGNVEHEIVTYTADHAFDHPIAGLYSARVAGEAWEKTRAFLDTHVKAPAEKAAAEASAEEGDGGAEGDAGEQQP